MSEQKEVLSFETTSPLTLDDFKKKKSLYVLLNSIKNNYKANWTMFPYTEKYCHCAGQCFLERYSECGGNPVDGFKLIDRVINLPRGMKVKDVFHRNCLTH